MSHFGNPEKARRYADALDQARCEGKWQEVPELVRKLQKHAAARKCLVLTAQLESQTIALATRHAQDLSEPSRAAEELENELRLEMEHEKTHAEDLYHAHAALAWWNWSRERWQEAVRDLPAELPCVVESTASQRRDWSYVCAIRSAYVGCSAEEALDGSRETVLKAHENRLKALLRMPVIFEKRSQEHRHWWERFLRRCCELFHHPNPASGSRRPQRPASAFLAYRSWARYQAAMPQHQKIEYGVSKEQRRSVWKSYYDLASQTLQENSNYPSFEDQRNSIEHDPRERRAMQAAELERIEKVYESVLMHDVVFPDAQSANLEVDRWTDQVIANWREIMDSDGGSIMDQEGGGEAYSRRVLEILYRAATRTFQSTTILRHLFTVHVALAEFAIARKALDSYVEIVTKGKERAEKAGQAEPGLDTDEQMLQTMAAGVTALCEYGRRDEAIRAQELADLLAQWLAEHEHITGYVIEGRRRVPQTEANESLAGHTLALVHRAIGVSRATWAAYTFEAAERATLRAAAVSRLRQAVRADVAAGEDPYVLYPLAHVLAESRDTEAAVVAVKSALASETRVFTEPVDQASFHQDLKTRSSRSKPLVGCWHLLALLLSARQEFETAQAAVQAAVDHLETINRQGNWTFLERTSLVEAKLTQMALAEIVDGPEEALNTAGELLETFGKLFDLSATRRPLTMNSTQRPETAVSTSKSFRASLFGRSKTNRHSVRSSHAVPSEKAAPSERVPTISEKQPRLSQETSKPPTIAITNGDQDLSTETKHHHHPARSPSHKLHKRPSQKSVRRSRGASPASRRNVAPSASSRPTTAGTAVGPTNGQPAAAAPPVPAPPSVSPPDDPHLDVGVAVTHDLRASVTAQLDALATHPFSPDPAAPAASPVPGPAPGPTPRSRRPLAALQPPAPRFGRADEQRRTSALLSRVWLAVAALYRRAGLPDDARGAVDEAFRQARLVEAAVAALPAGPSAAAFADEGWAGAPSAEAVWANAYAEMGELALAGGRPHEALLKFEGALSHEPDHQAATVGLANIFLDMYAGSVPPHPPEPPLDDEAPVEPDLALLTPLTPSPSLVRELPLGPARPTSAGEPFPALEASPGDESAVVVDGSVAPSEPARPASPPGGSGAEPAAAAQLDRLAARDRAHALLTNLTRLGRGWADGAAWFALARACEESGQASRAREILWWVVELEGRRPVREWAVLGKGRGGR